MLSNELTFFLFDLSYFRNFNLRCYLFLVFCLIYLLFFLNCALFSLLTQVQGIVTKFVVLDSMWQSYIVVSTAVIAPNSWNMKFMTVYISITFLFILFAMTFSTDSDFDFIIPDLKQIIVLSCKYSDIQI